MSDDDGDDGITTPPVKDASHQNRSARASVASPSPLRYSSAPPRYSSVFGVSAQQVTTEGVSHTERTYNICSGLKNKPWVTFRVLSQPSLGASSRHQDFPRFSSGDMVAGLIELTLDSPQTINSITVSLHGRVIKGYLAEGTDTFLDHHVSIWTRADGDPHFRDQASTKKFNGRLNGAYQFPFAFPFPTLVDISTSTAFPPPFQDPVGTSSNSSPSDATLSPTRSRSLLYATTPPTSRFRSQSIPANATFFSGSKKAQSTQVSNDTNTDDASTAYISMRGAGQLKNSLNKDRRRNQGSFFSMPSSPQESDSKARLKRAVEEQDRILAQIEGIISNRLPVHVYPTPQTFLERGIRANVQYELSLHIAYGMLRPASKLKTAVVYTPSIIPPLASVARQQAYIQGSSLPEPAADPDGWQTLPKVMVYGKLPRRPEVEVECTLSLAKPLCYTRGTVIPCYLTLECLDVHALDLLSTLKSPIVRLTRRVRYTPGASSTTDAVLNEPSSPFGTLSGDPFASPTKSYPGGMPFFNGKRGDMIEEIDEVELAVWWVPANGATQEMYLRKLEGEIHLAKDLQPTCRFLPFSVEVCLCFIDGQKHLNAEFARFLPVCR
ncbi:uncharacterized protein LACBIDRAFT_302914 [Laccaria bicolor S238N-H82]|uniref:Predicted protein n=1 Tax=Laccaria bicolor (strain S238N-H82 / ATCC MYA-4686) TaxID=486041 RepID=B0DIL4_LACBS|nr:uncharacterized protein LACBIDRAFT_302914 [Laccaria bicolor S238N-H82]EDR05590.1 predicted protein [Laccaria bicolor S238N-H82]|eukprot:XP_001883694.1 predicted protein [Laccaria bicolor S238N-H82]